MERKRGQPLKRPASHKRKSSRLPRSPNPGSDLKKIGPAGPGRNWIEVADILEAFPCYVMLVDESHHILMGNSAVQHGLGLDPATLAGRYCPEAVHGLNQPWHACPLEESVEKWAPVERESFDPQSGRWTKSAIYPTEARTCDGQRILFHMVSDVTESKETQEQLKYYHEQSVALSRYLESVREEERTRLAREIHDELGHLLTGLKIDLSWFAARVGDGQREKVASMTKLLDSAILTAKRISTDLRPGVLDDLGLSAAIEWQSQEFQRLTGTATHFRSLPADIVVDRERSTALFRICQEALTNVVRHAAATRVELDLIRSQTDLALTVKDDGKGIESSRIFDQKSFGLIGMRERASQWAGSVTIRNLAGKGTEVTVTIPLFEDGRC